jgi:hypothetical protein
MDAWNVVHDEFLGVPAKSTQFRIAQGCRAQMAASLAMFFFSIAPSRSRYPIELFTLLAPGSRMSSSLNDKCFFSWIFWPPDFWSLAFYFDLMASFIHWGRCWIMGPTCQPLCTVKFSFLGLFLAPDIWSFAFFFRSHAAFEMLRTQMAHGSHISASMNNKPLFCWI